MKNKDIKKEIEEMYDKALSMSKHELLAIIVDLLKESQSNEEYLDGFIKFIKEQGKDLDTLSEVYLQESLDMNIKQYKEKHGK